MVVGNTFRFLGINKTFQWCSTVSSHGSFQFRDRHLLACVSGYTERAVSVADRRRWPGLPICWEPLCLARKEQRSDHGKSVSGADEPRVLERQCSLVSVRVTSNKCSKISRVALANKTSTSKRIIYDDRYSNTRILRKNYKFIKLTRRKWNRFTEGPIKVDLTRRKRAFPCGNN